MQLYIYITALCVLCKSDICRHDQLLVPLFIFQLEKKSVIKVKIGLFVEV